MKEEKEERIFISEDEKKEGWFISKCKGNTYKKGCNKTYKKLNWYTPSGCKNCHASFVE